MTLLIAALFAGVLTVAAPCILPLLPIIIGGASLGSSSNKRRYRPVVIASSLGVSVIVFSLLLKATTALLGVPQIFWNIASGTIVLLFGISIVLPELWEKLMLKTGLYNLSNTLSGKASQKNSYIGDALLGASLGPVFSSCSPTYALIVAIILPSSFFKGLIYLTAYAVGLSGTLLLIALLGRRLTTKLGLLANPTGWFKRIIGVMFIIVGIAVITGLDKKFQTFVLDQGWYGPIERLEQRFMVR